MTSRTTTYGYAYAKEESAKALGMWLNDTGQSTSIQPRKAVEQASKNTLTLKRDRAGWQLACRIAHTNAPERCLPLICKWFQLINSYDTVTLRSEDSTLTLHYKVYKNGTAVLQRYLPRHANGVVKKMCEKLDPTTLVPLLGIHQDLDAYIRRCLVNPQDLP